MALETDWFTLPQPSVFLSPALPGKSHCPHSTAAIGCMALGLCGKQGTPALLSATCTALPRTLVRAGPHAQHAERVPYCSSGTLRGAARRAGRAVWGTKRTWQGGVGPGRGHHGDIMGNNASLSLEPRAHTSLSWAHGTRDSLRRLLYGRRHSPQPTAHGHCRSCRGERPVRRVWVEFQALRLSPSPPSSPACRSPEPAEAPVQSLTFQEPHHEVNVSTVSPPDHQDQPPVRAGRGRSIRSPQAKLKPWLPPPTGYRGGRPDLLGPQFPHLESGLLTLWSGLDRLRR